MFCEKCGAQIPDDSIFCPKCGYKVAQGSSGGGSDKQDQEKQRSVVAAPQIQEFKCPSCGAPLKPQLGEMIITCEYCGASVSLFSEGWKNIEKHTMLPLKIGDSQDLLDTLKLYMDRGLLHKHLEEESKCEQTSLAYVPYWVVPVSARTNYTAVSAASEVGEIAGSSLLMGLMGGAMGGRGGLGMGLMGGAMVGGVMAGGMGSGNLRAYTYDQNYNYPVVAVKSLLNYQPKDYSFDLGSRVIFDISKITGNVKALNGDVGEDSAKYEAKTYVDQLQSQKVHSMHHMVQQINTKDDVGDPELLHVPVWFAKFSYKKDLISLVIDGSNGRIINSIGLKTE